MLRNFIILITFSFFSNKVTSFKANFEVCKVNQSEFIENFSFFNSQWFAIVAIAFPKVSTKENDIYNVHKIVNCGNRIVLNYNNQGIIFSANRIDSEDCRPFFVPFAANITTEIPKFNEEIMVANHSIITHINPNRFITIYTCIIDENEKIDEAMMIFVSLNIKKNQILKDIKKITKMLSINSSSVFNFKFIEKEENMCKNI
ncbi:hypothetical protein PVAND_006926 [Polypedilum vanderplanki]|uniref:Uncharacterized protein n=1 Tax=Polypedilum vanderplanki TaxID=319348 RepID=A0A9J6C5M4_POLVA|nr:hypothetical protein PVAND_006926 [Polypedilum vanderplanki]